MRHLIKYAILSNQYIQYYFPIEPEVLFIYGVTMVYWREMHTIILVISFTSTYAFSGEITPYADPSNCANNEYFDIHLLRCVVCDELKYLVPSTSSKFYYSDFERCFMKSCLIFSVATILYIYEITFCSFSPL